MQEEQPEIRGDDPVQFHEGSSTPNRTTQETNKVQFHMIQEKKTLDVSAKLTYSHRTLPISANTRPCLVHMDASVFPKNGPQCESFFMTDRVHKRHSLSNHEMTSYIWTDYFYRTIL